MNQLEKWHRNRVVSIQMAEEAHDEAIRGNNPERARKARSYIYSIELLHNNNRICSQRKTKA
jgi:hypothetical protein